MLINYLKIAFRNFTQNKGFALLSILSLTVALTSVILISMYAKQEFSYDRFHNRSGDLYRLVTVSENLDVTRETGFVPLALGPHLKKTIPAVEEFARVWIYRRSMPVSNPDRDIDFYEDRMAWADESFFRMFDFEITAGNREAPLGEFRSVVISESMAEKYFGEENPVGRSLYFRGEVDIPLIVTAVMQDFPAQSHIQFDFVANIKTAAEDFWAGGNATQGIFQEWANLFVPAYIMIQPGSNIAPVLEEATRQVNSHLSERTGARYSIQAQPIKDIHLTSQLDVGEFEINGSRRNVYAVMLVGLMVLVLGCFNFVNLVTAQAGKRLKEVGLRKTLGGTRSQLMAQHYFESFLMVVFAVMTSFLCVELLLPFLNGFIHSETLYTLFSIPVSLIYLQIFVGAVVILAGAYPAMYVSSFSAGMILKGGGRLSRGHLRKVLVTVQFALCGILIVSTLVVYQQLQFLKSKDLGFSEEQIVVIPIHRDAIIPNLNRIREAFIQNPQIRAVSASSHLMFADFTYTNTFGLYGMDREYLWERYTVEADYPTVYDLRFVAGRSFRAGAAADSHAVILNEQAVAELGLEHEDAVGQILENRSMNISGPIVGVVEDFHFQSLHEDIQPFVLINRPGQVDFISVKINTGQVAETIAYMDQTWTDILPEASFGYFFLDSSFESLYQREENLGNAIIGFSTIAIFLACLGLFGLSLFSARSRTKEIGVRKVLGASVWDIVQLLGLDFTKLVAFALAIALPLSWILMNRWLNDFAYRIDISPGLIAVAAATLLLVSWLTVSWHSIHAATGNPVESLKSE